MKKEEGEESTNDVVINKFTFICRKDELKRNGCDIDFWDRNYRVPLLGCTNFERLEVNVGDIVGVILKSSVPERVKFDVSGDFLTEERRKLGGAMGTFYRKEEHLFRIQRKLTNSKFLVSQVFIHGNNVIRKEISESFERVSRVKLTDLNHEKLVGLLLYQNIVLPEKEIAEPFKSKVKQAKDDWDSFRPVKCDAFIEDFHILVEKEENPSSEPTAAAPPVAGKCKAVKKDAKEKVTAESILRKLPYRDLRKTIFEFDYDYEPSIEKLQRFCSFLEENTSAFISVLGEELYRSLSGDKVIAEDLPRNRIYERIIKHRQDLIQEMVACLPPRVSISLDNYISKTSALEIPKIQPKNPITTLKLSQIYRVYRTDPRYCMRECSTVTDWSGILLPLSIRSELQAGDKVRLVVADRVEESKELERVENERQLLRVKKQKERAEIRGEVYHLTEEEEKEIEEAVPKRHYCDRVIYFTILLPLTETKYLAQIYNCYMSVYEDIVLVIDSRAISEIPLSWSENPHFKRYQQMIESGEIERMGYSMTGVGAMQRTNILLDFENDLVFRLGL